MPGRPSGGGAGRLVAAIAALPVALLLAVICLAGTFAEFAECSRRAASCSAGTIALLGILGAVAGGAVAIAGLTESGRRTARRAGLAWAALGGTFLLLVVAAAAGA